MGHPFSAVQRLVVAVLGQFKGHTKQTWYTSLELNWPFLPRVVADNAKCPEIYFWTLTMYLGHWLAHRKHWSQQEFQRKPLRRYQARPRRTAGVGVMNNGTTFGPSKKLQLTRSSYLATYLVPIVFFHAC